MKKIKILIVGGTGFIGYHLARRAVKEGWQVTSISTNKPKKIRKISKVRYLLCDISSKKSLKKKLKIKFNYVVNLGGYVDHTNSKKVYKSHYLGCVNLIQLLIKNPPLTFVQMGSSGEYGKLKSPHKEYFECKPISIYAKSKLLASKYLLKMYKKNNFPSVILRLYQSYGPKQDQNRFIPFVIASCLMNKNFPCSDGKQFRDFLHVDDVVEAIIKSLNNKNAIGEIFNLGTGKPKKIKDIIYKLNKFIKKGNPEFGKIKMRKDEYKKIFPSIKKANIKLKWYPKISFAKGLKQTIKFYDDYYKSKSTSG